MPLSLLIPTYHRPAKLARLLHHLTLQLDLDLSKALNFELIIADGYTDKNLSILANKDVNKFLKILKNFCKVEVLTSSGLSISRRIHQLTESSNNPYLMLLGDDDLVILKNCLILIEKKLKRESDITIAGRLVNITGLGIKGVRFNVIERPYVGFDLNHISPIVRIAQYFTLNAIGTTALFYSIQSKNVLQNYNKIAIKRDYYGGGLEFIHQINSLIRGPVIISEIPLIFRDFTYLDYKEDSMRVAPDTDEYPYYGLEAINAISKIISEVSDLDVNSAKSFIDSIINLTKDLEKSRNEIEKNQIFPLKINIDSDILKIVNKVWISHLNKIYSSKSAMTLKIGRIPGLLTLYRRIREMM